MKFRNGFVSNSSSSSFIIIGKEIFSKTGLEDFVNEGKIYARGKFLDNGEDFFLFTKEMYEKSQEYFNPNLCLYYVHTISREGEEEIVLTPEMTSPENKFKAIVIEIDDHHTKDSHSFSKTYW